MRTKALLIGVIFAILSLHTSQQANPICYSNCKQYNCSRSNPLNCTDCDLGLVNINGACIGGSNQQTPQFAYKPTPNNLIPDANGPIATCSLTADANPPRMVFVKTIGSSSNNHFVFQSAFSYLQVKLTALILTKSTGNIIMSPSINVNVVAYPYLNTILRVTRSITNPMTAGNISCIVGSGQYYANGVINVNQKVSGNNIQEIAVIVQGTDPVNYDLYLADIQIYFGTCDPQCGTCSGPTNSQCLSCRGLYLTIQNITNGSSCATCPNGFYSSVSLTSSLCLACPPQCLTCTSINSKVYCLSCDTNISNAGNTSTVGGVQTVICTSNYTQLTSLGSMTDLNSTLWQSSATSGQVVTSCGLYKLVGGIAVGTAGSTLQQTFHSLPAHTLITIKFTLFLIDQVPGDYYVYTIIFDSNTPLTKNITIVPPSPNQNLTDQCGTSGVEYASIQQWVIPHSSDSIHVSISGLKDYFGFRDFVIALNNKTNVGNCSIQNQTSCVSCKFALQLQNNSCSGCANDSYFEPGAGVCTICPINCQSCNYDISTYLITCTSCHSPFALQNNQCVDNANALYDAEIMSGIPSSTFHNNGWTMYPKLQNNGMDKCGADQILGSEQIKFKFITAAKNWSNLPAHTGVSVHFHFYQIDTYPADQSVFFILDGQNIPYVPLNRTTQICGDPTPDAIQKIYLQSNTHTGSTLNLQFHMARKGKFGINNILLFLLNCPSCSNTVGYNVELMPVYSIDTPPVKGYALKMVYPNEVYNSTLLVDAFNINIQNTGPVRLLQGTGLKSLNGRLPLDNAYFNSNRQIVGLISPNRSHISDGLTLQAFSPNNIYAPLSDGVTKLIANSQYSTTMPRYVDIDDQSITNRSSMRNLRNLFTGCAIIALWIGMASFIFGMSAAFDDFFLLCQVIFVHVFIQLAYNPPSYRVPMQGLEQTQFMLWLPMAARNSIESGIIPGDLYQYSPIPFEQYFQDIVFARAIYHWVLFAIIILIIFLILWIIKKVQENRNIKEKYQGYFVNYYVHQYNHTFAFIDKAVRFGYFTVVWACLLQFLHFDNSPTSFHQWNSAICIILFILAVLYPVAAFFYLRHKRSTISSSTFNALYEQVRISRDQLWYFIVRYYKFLLFAVIIAATWNSSPVIPCVILMVANLVDVALILIFNPLGMVQQVQLGVMFYAGYPLIYKITTVIQCILFFLLEMFILIMFGQRGSATNYAYMGLGYVCDAIVILLLINGLVRLIYGFIKIAEYCHAERTKMNLSVDKRQIDNLDQEEQLPIAVNQDPNIDRAIRNQTLKSTLMGGGSRFGEREPTGLRKTSFVSKLIRQ